MYRQVFLAEAQPAKPEHTCEESGCVMGHEVKGGWSREMAGAASEQSFLQRGPGSLPSATLP